MVPVTQRISKVKQPRGGYIKSKDVVVTDLWLSGKEIGRFLPSIF